jgi:hypothetical protein
MRRLRRVPQHYCDGMTSSTRARQSLANGERGDATNNGSLAALDVALAIRNYDVVFSSRERLCFFEALDGTHSFRQKGGIGTSRNSVKKSQTQRDYFCLSMGPLSLATKHSCIGRTRQ